MGFVSNYKYESYTPQVFEVEDGEHSIRVQKAEFTRAKSGAEMIAVTFYVAQSNKVPYTEYFVEGEYFDRNISRFFDAFDIQPGNFQLQTWINKAGKAKFEHEKKLYTDRNGTQRESNHSRLKYFIVSNIDAANRSKNKQQYKQNATSQASYQQYAPNNTQSQSSYQQQGQYALTEDIPF